MCIKESGWLLYRSENSTLILWKGSRENFFDIKSVVYIGESTFSCCFLLPQLRVTWRTWKFNWTILTNCKAVRIYVFCSSHCLHFTQTYRDLWYSILSASWNSQCSSQWRPRQERRRFHLTLCFASGMSSPQISRTTGRRRTKPFSRKGTTWWSTCCCYSNCVFSEKKVLFIQKGFVWTAPVVYGH